MRVLVLIALLTSVVSADVPSPDEEECRGKAVGQSCDSGVCTNTKCSRSRPGPDGELVTTEWDCLRCASSGPGPTTNAPATAIDDDNGKLRIAIGMVIAIGFVGGGVWFARRKLKA